MAFWTDNAAASTDPKRNFRFRVSFLASNFNVDQNGTPDPSGVWYAKKVTQPKVTFTESKHDFLIHKFYWPAKAEWNEIDITLVDPVEPHVSRNFLAAVQASGFNIPGNVVNGYTSVSKAGAVLQLGTIYIEQIDAEGTAIHAWSLKHAWAKEISFSDLDYGNEDLSEVTLKVRYDWAEFESYSPDTVKLFSPSV